MDFSFFRKAQSKDDDGLYSPSFSMDDTEPIEPLDSWQHKPLDTPMLTDIPVSKAEFGRIGLVSVEHESAIVPTLLHGQPSSPLLQMITLPRNPRIASDELYEVESMDLLVWTTPQTISKETIRWMRRIKPMQIPMVVLIYQPVHTNGRAKKYQQFTEQTGVPIVAFEADRLDESRQMLLGATLDIAPAMAVALAANIDTFRPMLIERITATSIEQSQQGTQSLEQTQMQLVQQISVAHGCNGQQLKELLPAFQVMTTMVNQYTQWFVNRLPFKHDIQRTRFAKSLSTLFMAHATQVHHGESVPDLRRELVPQIWRLYRDSRQST